MFKINLMEVQSEIIAAEKELKQVSATQQWAGMFVSPTSVLNETASKRIDSLLKEIWLWKKVLRTDGDIDAAINDVSLYVDEFKNEDKVLPEKCTHSREYYVRFYQTILDMLHCLI